TTPDWGSAALACNACHGYGPSYANGTPKANNHVEHIAAGITCDKCHYSTTNDGTTIASKALHVNRAYNVTPNTGAGVTFTYTYAATGGSCSSVSCHGGTWTAIWGHTHDVSYNETVDLSQVSMPGDNPCADCHSGNNADGDGTPLNSWSDILSEHVTGCVRCHEYTDDGSGTPPQAANDNAIATGVGVTCTTCHTPKLDPAPASDHGGHDATHFGWSGGCQNCHGDGTATEAVVSVIHANACDLCHTTGGPYNKTTEKIGANGDGDATLANGAADAATPFDPTLYTCTTCHNQTQVPGFHGVTIAEVYSSHQLSSDSSGGYDCESCHSANIANEQLVTHMPADLVANCAIICHANTTPSATSGIVAKTVIDAVTWATDPNPNNSRCENCHAAKGDYRLHGLTDDASVADGIGEGATHGVAFHDNLGNSTGIAVSYSGKLASYGGIKATEYNCGQCHSADPDSVDVDGDPNISALEAMQLHTSTNGTGLGDCLTCHVDATSVADEITAGIGGTIQYCENCHASANGTGPSGKAMYQYDGVRHHALEMAQEGNCTWCHADPRPAATTLPSGYAATADAVGTYDTGWITDYATATPAVIPTQPACRLCHTNYETWSTDVNAEQDTDDNYTEATDVHGYHINGQAVGWNDTGLTVYANDFDNTNVHASKTYPSGTSSRNLRGVNQVKQSAIHRIDPNSGTDKIYVQNYGACLGCHSIQLFHAAPRPTLDFQVAGTNNNGLTYDTLRYAPGRSIFNLLPDRNFPASDDCGNRGSSEGNNPDDWDQHCEPEKYNGKTWNGDRGQDLMDNTFNKNPSTNPTNNAMFYDVYPTASWTQYSVPGDTMSNYESLTGIPINGTLYNGHGGGIVAFTTNPTYPSLNGIRIAVAEWQGANTVYVEAYTNSGDCADTLQFLSYTPGGCTSGNLTCSGGKYTGTCTDAVSWTAGDTVTLRNTSTASNLDDASRLVDDNSGPVATAAIDDSYSVATSTTTQLLVLSNDLGTNNTIISTNDSNLNANCSTAVAGGGTRVDITCGALAGAMGTFDYVVQGDLNSDTGTVTVTAQSNAAPTITVNQPDGVGDSGLTGDTFTINYDANDADAGDTISVDFYYDIDNSGENGTAIASCQNLTTKGSGLTCDWTSLPEGAWYVYGIVDDGTTTTTAYSAGTVVVSCADAARLSNWSRLVSATSMSGDYATGNYTVGAGSNRLLLVAISVSDNSANNNTWTVGWGGTDLTSSTKFTEIAENVRSGGNNPGLWIGYLNETGIAAQGNTNVIRMNSGCGCTQDRLQVFVMTLENINQSDPVPSFSMTLGNSDPISTGNITFGNNDQVAYVANVDTDTTHAPPATYTEVSEWTNTHDVSAGYRTSTTTGTTESISINLGAGRNFVMSGVVIKSQCNP
ncbi:MAG: hypothetical protein ACOY3O_09230, partial [Thermodesulfobacteriota bacterium]